MVECQAVVKKVGFDKTKLTITLETDPDGLLVDELVRLQRSGRVKATLSPLQLALGDAPATPEPEPLCVCGHILDAHEDDKTGCTAAVSEGVVCPCPLYEAADEITCTSCSHFHRFHMNGSGWPQQCSAPQGCECVSFVDPRQPPAAEATA